MQSSNPITRLPDYPITRFLRFSVRKKVGVDEVADERLAGGVDLLELHAHADAAVAPRHTAFSVDVELRPRQTEADLDARVGVERAGGADGDAAVTQVERQRGGDGVPEA